MKKIVVLLFTLMLSGCRYEKIEPGGTYGVTVFRHGNHQYIFVKHYEAGGLCHYEDCDYCNGKN